MLVSDLQRRGELKRDGIHTLLCELHHVGYVHYQRQRDTDEFAAGPSLFKKYLHHHIRICQIQLSPILYLTPIST
jgi:hypothetical protein